MTITVAIVLTLAVMFLIRLSTGPFLYHIAKGCFWIVLAYSLDTWHWSLIAGWDIAWILIWLERDPYKLN